MSSSLHQISQHFTGSLTQNDLFGEKKKKAAGFQEEGGRKGRGGSSTLTRGEKQKAAQSNLIILTHCNMTKNILERDSTASYVCLEERAA